jgi:hypothetical protein
MRNATPELVNIVLESVVDWMSSNLDRTEYDYFPPSSSKFLKLLKKSIGTYTVCVRFLNYKMETEYLGYYLRDPRVHITLINLDPDETWILRGDFVYSQYAPKPLFVGEVSGEHAEKFDESEVVGALKHLLLLSWDDKQ